MLQLLRGSLNVSAKRADELWYVPQAPDRGMMGDDGKDCFGLVGSLDLDVTGSVQGRVVLPWPPAL